MKKFNLVVLATIAILSSCSNEETMLVSDNTKQQSAPISFSNAFVNKSTRTAVTDNSTLDNFSVWGYAEKESVFVGEEVTKADGAWTYNSIKYWVPGKAYTFTAIAPSKGSIWSYTPTDELGGSIHIDNDGEQDLVYAYQTSAATENTSRDKVKFTFNHLLTRAKFKFINGTGENEATFQIKDIAITDADASGDITVSAGSFNDWSIDNGTFEIAYDATGSIEPQASESTDYKYLIPHADAHQYSVNFTIVVTQGESTWEYKHRDVKTESVKMESGKSYIYAITLTKDNINPDGQTAAIEFSSETDVIDWDAEQDKKLGESSSDSNSTSGTAAIDEYENDEIYVTYNPRWYKDGNNSIKMTRNSDGLFEATATTLQRFVIIDVEKDQIFAHAKVDGNNFQYELDTTFTLDIHSFEGHCANIDYCEFAIDPKDNSDATNVKLIFDPNKAELTIVKM